MNRKGKILLSLLMLLLLGGGLVVGIKPLCGDMGDYLPDKKPSILPKKKKKSTFKGPPKDLFEYGKDVELPEKKEEPGIIDPWQKRILAGGKK